MILQNVAQEKAPFGVPCNVLLEPGFFVFFRFVGWVALENVNMHRHSLLELFDTCQLSVQHESEQPALKGKCNV